MASKKYAYYNKGNKIAIIQQDQNSITSGDYGQYKSPTSTVTNGLEIEYTYIPEWTINSARGDLHPSSGWFIKDGYLWFTFYDKQTAGGTPAAKGSYAKFEVGEYFEVRDSSQWDGVHKIQSLDISGGSTTYALQTFTKASADKYDVGLINDTLTDVTATTGEVVYPDSGTGIWLHDLFEVGDYCLFTDFASGNDAGMHIVTGKTFDTIVTNESDYRLTFASVYWDDDTATYKEDGDPNWNSDTSFFMYKVQKDHLWKVPDVIPMTDETFDIDLTRYQSRAIVYYLKAKFREDMNDMEGREYFMRLFNIQMEKGANSRQHGTHMIQGHWNLR